jgi:hypothetical protein
LTVIFRVIPQKNPVPRNEFIITGDNKNNGAPPSPLIYSPYETSGRGSPEVSIFLGL